MFIQNIIITWIFFSIVFIISKITDKLSIIDSFWSLSFMFISSFNYVVGSQNDIATLITIIVFLWGIRLASHISFRNLGKKEDYRYQDMRNRWDKVWLTAYFKVFLLQGVLMLMIAFPIIIINQASVINVNAGVIIGVLIWTIGYIFESVGDYQLKKFLKLRKDPQKVMTKGLWKYTRHPNYFGEVTMWWGIFIIISFTTNNFFTILSPITITFLILKVSGVPLLEKKYEGRPSFEEYKKHTNKFLPWFPKK